MHELFPWVSYRRDFRYDVIFDDSIERIIVRSSCTFFLLKFCTTTNLPVSMLRSANSICFSLTPCLLYLHSQTHMLRKITSDFYKKKKTSLRSTSSTVFRACKNSQRKTRNMQNVIHTRLLGKIDSEIKDLANLQTILLKACTIEKDSNSFSRWLARSLKNHRVYFCPLVETEKGSIIFIRKRQAGSNGFQNRNDESPVHERIRRVFCLLERKRIKHVRGVFRERCGRRGIRDRWRRSEIENRGRSRDIATRADDAQEARKTRVSFPSTDYESFHRRPKRNLAKDQRVKDADFGEGWACVTQPVQVI